MEATEEQIAEEMSPDEGVPDGIDPETGEIIEPEAESQAQEPEQAAPRSQKEIDALTARLKAEADRHEKRVREIMGEDFALLVPSPVDWTPGYIFNVPEMHPTPEQLGALYALLGQAPPADYPDDPGRTTCDMCLGTTKLKTGSLDPIESALPCRFCQGHGWIGEGNAKVEPFKFTPVAVPPADTAAPINTLVVPDAWGRPYGHPHYGLLPSQVI